MDQLVEHVLQVDGRACTIRVFGTGHHIIAQALGDPGAALVEIRVLKRGYQEGLLGKRLQGDLPAVANELSQALRELLGGASQQLASGSAE